MKQAQVSVTPHVRECVCVLCLCVWPKVNEQLFGQVKKKQRLALLRLQLRLRLHPKLIWQSA